MSKKGAVAIISICSSGPKRLELLKQFAERISFANQIVKTSHIYETQDAQNIVHGAFLSCCMEIETDMESPQLVEFLLETKLQIASENEEVLSKQKVIDCDLIDFRGEIIRTPKVTIPHPDTHKKAYMIMPLAEMEPDWRHPVLKKSAIQLANEVFWPGWGSFFASKETLLDF